MAAVNSPFQCGGSVVTLPVCPRNFKIIIRVDTTTGATIKIKKNGDPTVGQDYLLAPGDAIEIPGNDFDVVSLVNSGADPSIYWTTEHQ